MNLDVYKLFLVQFVGDALLLWLGYEWLSVGETSGARLALSAVDALAILALVCWLHGASFAFFRMQSGAAAEGPPSNSIGVINAAFRTALRNLAPLLLAALLVLTLYGGIAWAASASGQPAFKIASWMTLKSRTPVKPAAIVRIFNGAFWILRWAVLPVALLPLASGIATRGWRGFREISWRANWLYWLVVPGLLAAGLIGPFTVLAIVPAVKGFGHELISFVLRALLAYLVLVVCSLALARATATCRAANSPSTQRV